ncbi:MAG TPA: hypothetical protein VHC48_03735, partial [Puia sp.]|nr:hypothetical protein [Puia sp.]
MATDIKCPNCGHQFPIEEAVSEEYKKELREQMQTFLKSKEKEFQKKEQDLLQHAQQQEATFLRKLEEEKRQIQQTTEQSLRKSISTDYETKMRLLEDANKDNEEKLR